MRETAIHRQVAAARAGTNPAAVTRLPSGWLVMGERQVVPGYCLLLPDPVVPHLNELAAAERRRFLDDMAAAGDVLLRLTGAARINDEMLGNLEPALHAHLFPRREDEPEATRTKPVFQHDWSEAPAFDPRIHGTLQRAIADALVGRTPGHPPAGDPRRLSLRTGPGGLAVCRLPADAPVPDWAWRGPFTSVTRTPDELSVTCAAADVPAGIAAEGGWRALELVGPFPLDATGVLAAVTGPLADAGVSVFAVATHDTDWVLVKEDRVDRARAALAQAGHALSG